ncbi:fimbria/pilus outer membrane usher protein [uncultured Acinetobacter sp.]|uniref:fimbria/pilus outer membrane usher protein n=1 Tax=uncultured Acinetobacter sp. TaxID=165433 RepID=UPI00258A93C2|nr:fimbria/pilus outer membrane usher protein [uncultured Acinetobacter sp.]
MKHFTRRYSVLALSLYLCNQNVVAQSPQFDNSFLYGQNSKNIDLEKFISSDKVAPNDYILDIYLNDRYITRSIVHISDDPEFPEKQRYCIPRNTVKQLDFNHKLIDLDKVTNNCIDTRLMNHVVFWKLNIAEQRVDVTSPQSMLNERPSGYIDPSLWETGGNSAFLKYYYNYYNSDYGQDNKQDSSFLNINSGINIGQWQFRHSGSTSFGNSNNQSDAYISYENKLMRVLPALKSQLTLGDFYTNTKTINSNSSIAIRGVQLASDDRMLPISLQSYAPTISGYAKSNALVRVRQNQQIIMERTVPAGAFNIADLQTPGTGGTLNVDIIEANGEIHSYDLPYNNFIQSIRANQYRYQIAAGNFRQNSKSYDEKLINASFDYGLNNFMSVSSSALISDHYQSYIFGTALNTQLGGFALESNYVKADINQFNQNLDSYLLTLRYNLALNNAKTNISLNSTIYGNDEYYTFDEVMQNRYIQNNSSAVILSGRPKSSNYIQLTQNLGHQYGAISANFSQYKFWHEVSTQKFYQVSYSNSYKGISYYIGMQHTQNDKYNFDKDTQYFVNVNIPLSFKKKNSNLRLSSEVYPDNNALNTSQIGIFGNLGENQQFGYNFNYANSKDENQFSSSLSYRTNPIYLASTYTTDFDQQQQYSVQAQGAIVAHQHGITLANDLNDTFAIIHAKGLEGTSLSNGNNIKIDRWGNAIIPYLNPYQYNSINLNPNTIPLNTDVDATQLQVVPKSNASIFVDFKALKTTKALIELKSDDIFIPMGALVKEASGNTVTTVGQGQQVFMQNISPGRYTVDWTNTDSCHFDISNELLQQSKNQIPFASFSLNCK